MIGDLVKWNLMTEKLFKQAELKRMEEERSHQQKYQRKLELYRHLAHDNERMAKQIKTLESDLNRMVVDKKEVIDALSGGPKVTKGVTLTGSIDGHQLEVRGLLNRKGPNSHDPPSPCKNCSRMLSLGTTDLMMKYGCFCKWAGASMKGHIESWPSELREVFESELWGRKFRYKRGNYN